MNIESKENWYVLFQGEEKSGPYDYKKMIQMIQKNELMDYHYVWAPHLSQWTQVYNLKEFSKDRLLLLLQSHPEYQEAFVQRKNPRVQVNAELLGHNNIRFFDGILLSVSEQGGLVQINSPLVQVGDKLKTQIKCPKNSFVPFNVEATIKRKNSPQERINSKSGLIYVVTFDDIQPAGLETIKSWIMNHHTNSQAA